MSKATRMAEMHRFSSRRQRLDHVFLADRLKGTKPYKRIAGYFRSSIFELVGEEIADIPHVQIVCNLGDKQGEPNNLLDFMLRIGPRTKHLLLGTATPMQTEVSELWDLMRILNAGADFILGREMLSHWGDWRKALPVVKGAQMPVDERDAWEWLRHPLPPGDEEPIFASLRLQLGIPDNAFFTDRGFGSLGFFERHTVLQTLEPWYYREHNPIVRHTVLRRPAAHQSRRVHEDALAPAALFQLCLGDLDRRKAAARGRPGGRRRDARARRTPQRPDADRGQVSTYHHRGTCTPRSP